jgi:hypothetical protein
MHSQNHAWSLRGAMAVTIDYLLIGVGTLLALTITMFLIKLRAVNLRLRVLQAQIEDMHILTSRLLLRELNAPGDPKASTLLEKPARQEELPSGDTEPVLRRA